MIPATCVPCRLSSLKSVLFVERVVAAGDVRGEIGVREVDAGIDDGDVDVAAARERPDVARVQEVDVRRNDLLRRERRPSACGARRGGATLPAA